LQCRHNYRGKLDRGNEPCRRYAFCRGARANQAAENRHHGAQLNSAFDIDRLARISPRTNAPNHRDIRGDAESRRNSSPFGFSHFGAAQYFKVMKVWTFVDLYSVLIVPDQLRVCSFWMERLSMTMQFVDGILAAMLPSMLMVAWLVWRAAPADSDFLN